MGDNGYFQTAQFIDTGQSVDGAELTVNDLRIEKNELRILSTGCADFSGVAPWKVILKDVKPTEVQGKIVLAAVNRRLDPGIFTGLTPAAAILPYSDSRNSSDPPP